MKNYIVTVNGKKYQVAVEDAIPGKTYAPAEAPSAAPAPAPAAAPAPATPVADGAGTKVTAPMPGTILKVEAVNGQAVKKGDILCILEAMKMENEIFAPASGKVVAINTTKGASVNSGDCLIVIG